MMLDRTLDCRTSSVRTARHETARFLRERGFAPQMIEQAQLIVSELVTNAIEASPGATCHLVVKIENDRFVIRVRNRPIKGTRPLTDPPAGTLLSPRGRGLTIVQSLTDAFVVRERDGMIEVEAAVECGISP